MASEKSYTKYGFGWWYTEVWLCRILTSCYSSPVSDRFKHVYWLDYDLNVEGTCFAFWVGFMMHVVDRL
jgi:hypothetical protein